MNVTCQECGFIFKSNLISARNATVVMEGNTTWCPKCHGSVRLPDGKFQYDEKGRARLIAEIKQLDIPAVRLNKIIDDAQLVKSGALSENEFTSSVNQLSPQLFRILQPFIRSKNFILIISLLTIITGYSYKVAGNRRATTFQAEEIKTARSNDREETRKQQDSTYKATTENLRRIQNKYNRDFVKKRKGK